MFELNAPELEDLLKNLRQFTPKLQRRGLTQALRKGARPIVKDARARLAKHIAKTDQSQSTGALSKAITTRVNPRLGRREGGSALSIGIRGGAKEYVSNRQNRKLGRVGQSYEQGGNQFYFRFLEFGTSKMHARPFLTPALAENVYDTQTNIAMEIRKAIDRIASTGK
jgi:HK97 gp10 family phage protein